MNSTILEYTQVDRLPGMYSMNSFDIDFIGIIIVVIMIVGFIILTRWLVCWFNKTNQLVQQNKKIIKLLEQIRFNTAPK